MNPHATLAQLLELEQDVEDARIAYDGAIRRFARAKLGSNEERQWRAATSRCAKTLARLEARLARARAEAQGDRWLRLA